MPTTSRKSERNMFDSRDCEDITAEGLGLVLDCDDLFSTSLTSFR
jgi:hypothetical protein